MSNEFYINDKDVKSVKNLIKEQKDNSLVRRRESRNLTKNKAWINQDDFKQEFWFKMTAALLSSRQLSGPDEPVVKFMLSRPFPLDYEKIISIKSKGGDVKAFIADEIKKTGGLRYYENIGKYLAANLDHLENGGWSHALEQCNLLTRPVSGDLERRERERKAAHYFLQKYEDRKVFKGLGPKQSRNLLQMLGLTRFEIPIDSRIMGWLGETLTSPPSVGDADLSKSESYDPVSDWIQTLCERCGVFPCIFDASVFALTDRDGWDDKCCIIW